MAWSQPATSRFGVGCLGDIMPEQSRRAQRILLPLLNCGTIVLLWQLAVTERWISPLSLAAPFEVAKVAVSSFSS